MIGKTCKYIHSKFLSISLKLPPILILLCAVGTIQAQPPPEELEQTFLYGEFYFSEEKYPQALNFYLDLVQYDTTNCNLYYKIGKSFFLQPGERTNSIPYFEKAIENIGQEYENNNYAIKFAPMETWKLLGEAYQRNNQFELAQKAYNSYKANLSKENKKEQEIIEKKIKSVAYAIQSRNMPLDIIEENIGPVINTRFSDYNPVVSGDETVLIFTSFWESTDRIFMSFKKDGEWGKPFDITKEIGSEGDCYTGAISYDGKQLFVIKQGNFNSDIFVSKNVNGMWMPMEEIQGKINSTDQETSLSINKEGDKIYLGSNRSGGFGGFDLYISELSNDDRWSKPVNLGSIINTPFDEEAPFYSWYKDRLYFASEGHKNMGGMDIYYSDFKDGVFQKPINLGYPINTTGDNLYFFVINDYTSAYYSKPDATGFGRTDIIHVTFSKELGMQPTHLLEEATHEESYLANEETVPVTSDIKASTTYIAEANEPEIIPTYTIQLIALKKPVKTAFFSPIEEITVSYGNDSIYRYSLGEYYGYSKAETYIDSIRNMGYSDAFIRDIETISNYKLK